MLYPQNGERVVAIDSVKSLRPLYSPQCCQRTAILLLQLKISAQIPPKASPI